MPQPHHVLVVDDDDGLTALLCAYLAGFRLVAHAAGDDAGLRAQLATRAIDLVVLSVQLPGEDGLALARSLRAPAGGRRLPLILLGDGAQTMDRVLGLEMGADDFLVKPVEPRELVARIHAVLRRCATTAPAPLGEVVCFDGWALERHERRLTSPAGVPVALSDAEFRLLSIFLKSPRRVCSRDQLKAQARGRALGIDDRSIDLLVSRLRHKLADDPREPRMIKTVRGAGYLFDVSSVQAPAALAL